MGEIRQKGTFELDNQARLAELPAARPEGAVDHRLIHQPEDHLGAELDGELGGRVGDLARVDEDEGREAGEDLTADRAPAAKKLGALGRAGGEGREKPTALAVDADELADARAHDVGEARGTLRERGLEDAHPLLELAREALVEREEELVLVAKTAVEPADRRARGARDIGDRDFVEGAVEEEPVRRVEEAEERRVAPRLLRGGDAGEGGGGRRHSQIRIGFSF